MLALVGVRRVAIAGVRRFATGGVGAGHRRGPVARRGALGGDLGNHGGSSLSLCGWLVATPGPDSKDDIVGASTSSKRSERGRLASKTLRF